MPEKREKRLKEEIIKALTELKEAIRKSREKEEERSKETP